MYRRAYLQLLAIFAAYALAIMVGVWIEHSIENKQDVEQSVDAEAPNEILGEWRNSVSLALDKVLSMGHEERLYTISHYDEIFKNIGDEYGIDWHLMSAMAYTESRFKPDVESYSGAVGLMQIMPRTGRIYGVEHAQLFDPSVNIRVAAIHYRDIERMLSLPDDISDFDRVSLILASYNGGIGRVFDAQRLARSVGADPHLWSAVARQLLNLRYEEYYNSSVVRLGRFGTASQTVYYVNSIQRLYKDYLDQAQQAVFCYPY